MTLNFNVCTVFSLFTLFDQKPVLEQSHPSCSEYCCITQELVLLTDLTMELPVSQTPGGTRFSCPFTSGDRFSLMCDPMDHRNHDLLHEISGSSSSERATTSRLTNSCHSEQRSMKPAVFIEKVNPPSPRQPVNKTPCASDNVGWTATFRLALNRPHRITYQHQ